MMNSKELNFFPIIYPEELFYSVYSRYAYYTPFKGMDKLRNELFGYSEVRHNLKFAVRLAEFCSRTGNIYTPEEILQNHTVYPYFSPFLSRERQEKTLQAVSYEARHLFSNVGALRLSKHRNRVRYCPECARDDLVNYHECFLHTIHHLDGIDYCPRHLVRLLDYPLPRCFCLENNTSVLDPDKMNFDCLIKGNEAEEKLARIAGEIMKLPYNLYSIEDILTYLKTVFREKGLAGNRGVIHAKIYVKIQESFPESFLKENNLLLSPDKLKASNYLRDLFRNRSSAQPVVYLVLISLVADSFSEFIKTAQKLLSSEEFPKFNLCHNPYCPDFNKISARRVSVNGKKSAIFRCHCGQIYTQHPNYYHVVQWGPLYRDQLTKRIKQGATWKELEKETGLSRRGLIKQIKADNFTPIDQKLSIYEKELKAILDKSNKENSRLTSPEYYLSRNFVKTYDPDFLEIFKDHKVNHSHNPPSRSNNYDQQDELYYNQVTVIAEELYSRQPPVWVSQKRIISYFNPKITLSTVNRLTRTKEALNELSEDKHGFGLRKLIPRIKEILEDYPDMEFTEKNLRKVLGMKKTRFETYWPDVYNLFT